MAAEAARVLDYEYYNGTAAPVREFPNEAPEPLEIPDAHERINHRQRARVAAAPATNRQGVSLFAIVGTVFIAALLLLLILAQITYSQASAEANRLDTRLTQLNEQHRRLVIDFETVICMNEVESFARDVLGMSRPSSRQTDIIMSSTSDRAEVLAPAQRNPIREFGEFISSLVNQF